MKKYFAFDNESISGWSYFKRILISALTAFFLVGLWLAASTGYKRAGAFGGRALVSIEMTARAQL